MTAFAGRRGRVHLVRNHENRHTGRIPVPTVGGLTYDPMGKGGCTALRARRPQQRPVRAGRHRRHGRQLRGRAHPLGHLADLRGERGQGRDQRLHQGPRLHLRGRRRSGPAPSLTAAWAASSTRRSRSTRGAASSTRPRTPSRGRSGSSTASCPRSRWAARARCARAARWRWLKLAGAQRGARPGARPEVGDRFRRRVGRRSTIPISPRSPAPRRRTRPALRRAGRSAQGRDQGGGDRSAASRASGTTRAGLPDLHPGRDTPPGGRGPRRATGDGIGQQPRASTTRTEKR